MFKKTQQINTFKLRSEIKREVLPIRFELAQKQYIKSFFRGYDSAFKKLFVLFFLIISFELLIPVLTNIYLRKFSYVLDTKSLAWGIGLLIILICIYLTLNYFVIRNEKTLTLIFVNKMRKDWIKNLFNKNIFSFKKEDKGKLLVKISYHFSLLQMGINNCFFPLFQFVIMIFGLIVSAFFINTQVLIASLIFVPIAFLVMSAGYLTSAFYVSQEQTLYSRILQMVSDNTDDFVVNKSTNRETQFLKDLDNVVNIDNYFRVKREVVMNLGNKIIFAVLALFSAIMFVVHVYYPIFDFEGPAKSLVYILVFGLMIKALYLALRIGLFYFPLKLGLYISVPAFKHKKKFKIRNINKIIFKTRKVKINNKYIKNLEYAFEKGGRYLIAGEEGSGKSYLAGIFSGLISNGLGRNWIVKINKKRFLYKEWLNSEKNAFYINPLFIPSESIFNLVFNSLNENIYELDERIKPFTKIPIFNFIFEQSKTYGSNIKAGSYGFVEMFLLQVLYCLVQKPDFVIIDNLWLDLNQDRIREALNVLDKNLPNSTIILFSKTENQYLKYEKTYKI